MDKIVFKEKAKKYKGKNALGCSEDIYEAVVDIAEKSRERVTSVTNKLISYALEHVSWEE